MAGVGDRWRGRATGALAALLLAAPALLPAFDLTFGPFFEYDSDSGFHALRPLYAHDPESATDVAWPLGTLHRESDRRWWRAA